MSPRKLMFWLFACIFLVCALRAGLLTSADQYIYHLRNMHASTFAYRYDDFLPYLPIVAMFVLKLTGVKSRSNWKRMLVSTAFSYILMGTIVLTMKSLAGVLRPDGSDFLSFPSGMATHKGYTAPSIYQLCNIYNKTELEVLCSASAHVLTVYFHIYLIIQ